MAAIPSITDRFKIKVSVLKAARESLKADSAAVAICNLDQTTAEGSAHTSIQIKRLIYFKKRLWW